jgi:hypothetical protein
MSPWARIDDGFHSHPKVEATSLAGRGLFVTLVSYAANHLTDGIVPESVVKYHARGRGGRAALDELLKRGLLFRTDGAGPYGIHDYLDYNDSRAEVEGKRNQNRGRQERHRTRGKQTQIAWDGAGEAPRNAVTNASHSIPPTHTTPDKTPRPPSRGNAETLLEQVKADLRTRVPESTMSAWVDPLTAVSLEDDTLAVTAEAEHVRGWARTRWGVAVADVASRLRARPIAVAVLESVAEREDQTIEAAKRKRQLDRAEKRLAS